MSDATRTDVSHIRQQDGRAHLGDRPLSCGEPLELLLADGTFLEGRYEIGHSPNKHNRFFASFPIATHAHDPNDPIRAQFSCRIEVWMLFRAVSA